MAARRFGRVVHASTLWRASLLICACVAVHAQNTSATPADDTIVIVRTVDQFFVALSQGRRHIEIQQHLDLLPYQRAETAPEVLRPKKSTVSIRVRIQHLCYAIVTIAPRCHTL